MTIPHTSWLNMFPYLQLRDNLIFHQNEFSHVDFCNDLWGEFFLWNFSGYESSFAVCPPSSSVTEIGSDLESDDVDLASGKRGLIVWGEPWDLSGWEVTEGFVRKWSWLLEATSGEQREILNRWSIPFQKFYERGFEDFRCF
ncbi:hypothetical protein HYALB_00010300 [Hymenoscyphus albidus]|uniref:Uncharacterized protein n=1 Tax=Hymenoscyphus albidus TaxID=595503 RepID=A0A9N9M2Y6_9HELO|nr:hypothetical protein HYALB_00010300 [Hymenoscyphus albidus]